MQRVSWGGAGACTQATARVILLILSFFRKGPHSARPSFREPRCNYSFIDTNGRQLFDKNYPDAKDFSEELAPVGDGWLWGYIDKNGTVIIPLKYEAAEPFSEGLAAVRD